MVWKYVDPTAEQAHDWWYVGACMWCGDREPRESGCICRYCDCCSTYWTSPENRRETSDGRPSKQDCPDCVAWLVSEEGKAEMARQAAAREVRP